MKFEKCTPNETRKLNSKFGSKFRSSHSIWRIVWCSNLHDSDGEKVVGLCVYKEKTIFIDVSYGEIQETLVHEMFHAESAETGLHQLLSWSLDVEHMATGVVERILKNFELRKKHGR